jgi:hypothetical protein
MSRVADKIVMIVRSATKVVAWTTMPRSATKRAHDIVATLRDKALWAVFGVRLRHVTAQQPIAGAKACDHSRTNRFAHRVMVVTIRVVAFLAIHPVKPLSLPCGTYSEVPYGH